MENTRKTKHGKHPREYELEHMPHTLVKVHRPPDAYELYELEHMPHTLEKVPSYHANKPRSPLPYGSEYYEDGPNVDAEAEAFIVFEHQRFEQSRWMSMNGY